MYSKRRQIFTDVNDFIILKAISGQ